jgi:hypothetical protein
MHSLCTPFALPTPVLQASHTHLLFTPRPFSCFISATTHHTPHPQNAAFLTFKGTNTASTARALCSETCQTQASRMLTSQRRETAVVGRMFRMLRAKKMRGKKRVSSVCSECARVLATAPQPHIVQTHCKHSVAANESKLWSPTTRSRRFCHFLDFDPIQSPPSRVASAPLPGIVQTHRMH